VVGNLSFMLDLESYGAYGPPFKTNFSGNVTRFFFYVMNIL